jgi:hypothetical protein
MRSHALNHPEWPTRNWREAFDRFGLAELTGFVERSFGGTLRAVLAESA